MRKHGTLALRAALAAGLLGAGLGAPATAQAAPGPASAETREVLFVGNNWDGTVDIVTPDAALDRVGRLNVVPDLEERLAEIRLNPIRWAYFIGIRHLIGEGHDQFVDDMYTTPDGRILIVSRPSLADVVGIDTVTGELVWRFAVDGQRSDHMALSPDGREVAVSASTANTVHRLDVTTGEEIGSFPTGDQPHENTYVDGGERIVTASIGTVYTALDAPWLDWTKGDRYVQITDRETGEVVERLNMRDELAAAGHPDMSAAVRPMTFSPDERYLYFQVSFFHGFVEYDLAEHRVTRVAELPVAEAVRDLPREEYLLDSAHHGIAMNPEGTDICVAGTMSDYATVVDRETLTPGELVTTGTKPYWATQSADGEHCFVSWSGTDQVSAISYATGEEVGTVTVGDHPQRMRLGRLPADWSQE
ncbi:YncE family protein [Streptomyces millisiae]|uniref:PQQ-binding-like beta-propeller repeat protein n=1 Tax=Streptomyces millisiae TaxID=3075542 RepID=A0ABU2LJM3_9ACTN|nr:PQQ-binding-like beta-propeller repeat protein [Streptomyces sp. DSM 44918]MDT0317790.1 PQQ-binding-like beta-propeller repeat protein [Streptomyces sp. DSM 44918]